MRTSWSFFAGLSAYLNGLTSIISTILLVLFFIAGGFWGPLNDSVSVVWMLSFLPLAVLFYEMHKAVNDRLSLVVTLLGAAAMLVFAILQTALVLRFVQFEQTVNVVMVTTGVLGLWLLLNGLLSQRGRTLPAGLAWLTIGFGGTYLIASIGFIYGSWENPIAVAGFLVGAFVNPVWAFWWGRNLFNQPLAITG